MYQSPIVLVAEADMIKVPIKNAKIFGWWKINDGIFNHDISKAQSVLFLVEIIILVSSVYLGTMIRFADNRYLSSPNFGNFFISACVFASVMVLAQNNHRT